MHISKQVLSTKVKTIITSRPTQEYIDKMVLLAKKRITSVKPTNYSNTHKERVYIKGRFCVVSS